MKKFCVTYSYTTLADAEIAANTKEDAIKKVREVMADVKIDGAWEVKSESKRA